MEIGIYEQMVLDKTAEFLMEIKESWSAALKKVIGDKDGKEWFDIVNSINFSIASRLIATFEDGAEKDSMVEQTMKALYDMHHSKGNRDNPTVAQDTRKTH